MIPEITRPEWKDLITGKIKPHISSFSLQMKLSTLLKSYSHKLVSLDEAVKDLHEMCERYEKIYKADIDKIFN